jgi:hypothetical protein
MSSSKELWKKAITETWSSIPSLRSKEKRTYQEHVQDIKRQLVWLLDNPDSADMREIYACKSEAGTIHCPSIEAANKRLWKLLYECSPLRFYHPVGEQRHKSIVIIIPGIGYQGREDRTSIMPPGTIIRCYTRTSHKDDLGYLLEVEICQKNSTNLTRRRFSVSSFISKSYKKLDNEDKGEFELALKHGIIPRFKATMVAEVAEVKFRQNFELCIRHGLETIDDISELFDTFK